MVCDNMVSLSRARLICCRFWDEECVIYNQMTGETHLVEGMGAEVFKLISEKTVTRAVLLQKMHSVFETENNGDIEIFLDDLILQYQQLGLLDVMENSPV